MNPSSNDHPFPKNLTDDELEGMIRHVLRRSPLSTADPLAFVQKCLADAGETPTPAHRDRWSRQFRRRGWAAALAAGVLVAVGVGIAVLVSRGSRAGVTTVTVTAVPAGAQMGPNEAAAAVTLRVALPPRTSGYVTFLERWDDGSLVLRPDREQSWQQVETGDRPDDREFPLLFTSDRMSACTIFVLITDRPATAELKAALPLEAAREQTQPEFADSVAGLLRERGVRVRSVGTHELPATHNP